MPRKRAEPYAVLSAAVPIATYEKLVDLSTGNGVTLAEITRRVLLRGLVGVNQDAAARTRAEVEALRRAAVVEPQESTQAHPEDPKHLPILPVSAEAP